MTYLITAAAGAILGFGIALFVLAGRPKVRAANAVEAELKAYREKVSKHFAATATVVDDLTDRYRSVFEQLQAGADDLLDEATLRQISEDQGKESVTLHRLGWQATLDDGQAMPETPDQHTDSPDKQD